MNEEKQKNIGSLIVENEKQEKELKQYGKGLYKNIEQSLNGLFKQLHVTVIGLEKSFLSLCYKQTILNRLHFLYVLLSSSFVSFVFVVFVQRNHLNASTNHQFIHSTLYTTYITQFTITLHYHSR